MNKQEILEALGGTWCRFCNERSTTVWYMWTPQATGYPTEPFPVCDDCAAVMCTQPTTKLGVWMGKPK